jgi:DNA-binding transcriptional ArsR family regulator
MRLTTYGGVVADYRLHPEVKSGDPRGGPGVRGSVGFLPRLHVVATEVRHIGKESNRLEEVEDGLLTASDEVYTEYRDPRAEWEAWLPALRAIGVTELARRTGMSERTLRSRLNAGRLPRQHDRARLIELAQTFPRAGPRCRT